MSSVWDLVVVGAGPGGLAAAATAGEAGLRVCLLDDNASPGGQIWRSGPAKPAPAGALRWITRLQHAGVTMRLGWRVISAPGQGVLRIDNGEQAEDVSFARLVLATGARELFLPFPGWTLPGVYGAGGLQAFVKSGLSIAGKRVVIAGTGPLLLAVASGLRAAGAHIVAFVEQAPLGRLAAFAGALLSHPRKLGEAVRYGRRMTGVPLYFGAWITRAEGQGRLQRVMIGSPSRTTGLDADMLAIGYHLVPNTELPQLLGCQLEAGFVRVDRSQQTSVPDVYCVGEATGIGGVDKAQLEGSIAGLAAADRIREAERLGGTRNRHLRFAQKLSAAFALHSELRALATSETLLCRCEDVPCGAVAGCRSWREAKLHTRCGMGPCQGRICGPAAQFLFGWETPPPRPPLFPVQTAALCEPTAADTGRAEASA